MILPVPFCPCHFVRTILSVPFCPLPFCPRTGEFPGCWDWLWCPGLSPLLVSLAFSSAFHTLCFPFNLLHLPLDFIRVSPLWPMYRHPFGRPDFNIGCLNGRQHWDCANHIGSFGYMHNQLRAHLS